MLLFTSLFSGGDFGTPQLPGPHQYWRILITASQAAADPGQVAILELEMYSTQFGENQCAGGTPSASSQHSANYAAANAFNMSLRDHQGASGGANDELWASAIGPFAHWIQYDFGAGNEVEVNAIGMYARIAAFVGQSPSDFEVQHSDDGVDWTTAWSESGVSWSGFEFKRFVNPLYTEPGYSGSPRGAHTYWRLQTPTQENNALAELQFRATPGGADQATGGMPSASSVFSGSLTADKAFDDNGATLWSAANNSKWAWLRYQFAAPVEVAEAALISHADGFAFTTPREFAFQWSDDGITWTTAWALVAETGWTTAETRVYTDPNYEA